MNLMKKIGKRKNTIQTKTTDNVRHIPIKIIFNSALLTFSDMNPIKPITEPATIKKQKIIRDSIKWFLVYSDILIFFNLI